MGTNASDTANSPGANCRDYTRVFRTLHSTPTWSPPDPLKSSSEFSLPMKTARVTTLAVFASLWLPVSAAAQVVGKGATAAAASVRVRADIARFNQIRNVDELRTASTETVNRLSSELDTVAAEKVKLQRERDDLARQKAALTAERDALLAEKKVLAQEKVQLTAQNEKLRAQGRELETIQNELVATRAKLDREIAEQQSRHGTLLADNARLEQAGAQLKKDLDWKSLLVKIFSGSTVTGVLAVMGFMVSRRTSVLQNEKLELENQRLRQEVAAKP